MAPSPTPWPEVLREVVARCPRELAADECYRRLAEQGLEYGPEFRGLIRLRLGEREAVGELYCAGAMASPYRVPPQLLDSAFHALGVLSTLRPAAPGALLLPALIRAVRVTGRPTDRGTCHATLLEQRPDGTHLGRVQIRDATGAEVISVDGLVMRPAGDTLGARGWARERVYRVQWEERPASIPSGVAPGERPWLWLAAEESTARAVADVVRARGRKDPVVVWPPGGAPLAVPDRTFPVPAPGSGWEGALDAAGVERAVWLTPVLDPEQVAAECDRVLALCRGVARSSSTRFLITTFGAHAVKVDPVQASLWGLSRVFAREHPDRWGGLVDLPPELRADAARSVEAVLGAPDAEVALRDGKMMEPRLHRAPLPPPSGHEPFRPDASYLLIGGLGGVGLALAGWLVSRGVSRLLLMSRRPPTPVAAEAIAALERRGATVRVVTGDVARAEDVERAVAEPAALGWPALRGVFHLAVLLADGAMQNLDEEKVRTVLAPKVDGGWNLHRATAALDLDHFVLFSSMAALGNAGQAAYAAGNAFLDALAWRRRADGLPALSVGFGPISEVGAAARLQDRGRLVTNGLEMMPPDRTLETLGLLLASREPHALVASASWPTLSTGLPPGALRLYSALLVQAAQEPPPTLGPGALLDRLRALLPPERMPAFQADLRKLMAETFNLSQMESVAPTRLLQEVGLDSLRAVELRNALGKLFGQTFPSTLLFDHPTLESLATYLVRSVPDLANLFSNDEGAGTAPDAPRALLERLAELSDEEAAALAASLGDDEPPR